MGGQIKSILPTISRVPNSRILARQKVPDSAFDSSWFTDSHHGKAMEFSHKSPCLELIYSPASPMQALIIFYFGRAAPVPSIWEYVHRRVSAAREK